MWFIYAIITTCAWGSADLFYKKGAVKNDSHSHLKTSMMVGFVMGIHAIIILITNQLNYNPVNIIRYLPVSAMYILSMTIGYLGLRYLELSISSPVQNSSGAVSCILCLLLLGKSMDLISSIAVVLICGGIFCLGLFEYRKTRASASAQEAIDKSHSIGFIAFFIPVLYCIIDALGTFLDTYYLDDYLTTPLADVTEDTLENVVLVSYELTFLIAAILIFIYLKLIKKERIRIPDQKNRGLAAVLETAGQFTYVFAISGNGVVAAPMISAYSIVSLLLSRIFLKEKLSFSQYIVVSIVIIGIILLGIAGE